MLKAVNLLRVVRSYGKELLPSSRPLSTSLYRASAPAAAKGTEPSQPSSSAEKPQETANSEEGSEAAVITEAAGNKDSNQKSRNKTVKAANDAGQQPITAGKPKNAYEIALETNNRVYNYNQVLKKLASNNKPLTDKQMAALISIGGVYRGNTNVAIRREYLTNLVNTLKEQEQKPGILAMNALMAAKMDNEENVDVVEFLQQLENKGLELNSTSYELMAKAYAKAGNVNAILSILSHLKDEDSQNAINPLLNWLAYAEGMNGNVKNVSTIAKASNTENNWHPTSILYLNAAVGLAKKGEMDMVESILSRTKLQANKPSHLIQVFNIYMAFLSQKRLDALEKLSPYMYISQQTGCLPKTLNNNVVARHLDSLIASENYDAFEQVWNILPKEVKDSLRLQDLPAKQMLTYALKLMDEGRAAEYNRIIDAFRNAPTFPNSDQFFYYFIEEYFKRQNKPIDVMEAFSIYMKVTQLEGESTKKHFHRKTIGHLLRLALSTYKLPKSGDTRKHIYDIILDTIEQSMGKRERDMFQQQVLADVIGGRVFSVKKPSIEKEAGEKSGSASKSTKKSRVEVANLLKPSAV